MSVPVQDNYLAIYPFYCFGSLNLRIKCKRIFDSCVLLFNYQGSCLATAILDYHIFLACQELFLFFPENSFPQTTSQAGIPVCTSGDCCVGRYHAAYNVVIDFQEFQKFLRAPLSLTAMLEYHSISPLSTSFLNLLKIIFFIYNLENSVNLFVSAFSYAPPLMFIIKSTSPIILPA